MQKKKKIGTNNKIKISKSLRNILMILSIIIFAFGSGNLIKLFNSKNQTILENKEIYSYTNHIIKDSKINLKENQYVNEDEITSDQTYLSDLISDIDISFKYDYKSSQKSEIVYNYKIDAIVSATYAANNKTYDVINKTENLKKIEDAKIESDSFVIEEPIKIDYTKYHQMIKNFKQDMGISTNAILSIRLTVNTKTNINSEEIINTFESNYRINLGEKIAEESYEKEESKDESVKYQVETEEIIDINKKDLAINLIIMIIGFSLFMFVHKKTEELRTIKNEFKLELNRILRSCESKLVLIEDIKQIDIENATKVTDITQLLKLSDEALVPIYCYIKDEPEQEAYFIVTKYENNYIFILK